MRRKAITKIVIVSIIVVIIVLVSGYVLYAKTDLLKPNHEVFHKYFTQSIDFIDTITDLSAEEEYINTLKQKNYKDNTNIKLNYKNTQGNIEQFNSTITGVTSNDNKYSYRSINIKYGDGTDIANMEFLKEDNMYGILFADVVRQFVSIDSNNLDKLLENLNIDKNEYSNFNIVENIDLFKEKKKGIQDICLNFAQYSDSNQYTLQRDKMITLSTGETVTTRAYILKLSKEQSEKLYIDILRELEQEDKINEIQQSDNEFSGLTLTMYVLNEKAIRIDIEFENKDIRLECYDNEINVKYSNTTSEKIQTTDLVIKKENKTTYINYEDYNNNKINIEYTINQNDAGTKLIANTVFSNNEVQETEIDVEQKIDLDNNIEIVRKFENEQNVLLNNLDKDTLNQALSSLWERIDNKLVSVQNNINSELLNNFLEQNKQVENEYDKIIENEKEEFNNQFQLYKGQNIEKDIIYNMLDVAGKNLLSYQMIGDNKIKLYLKQNNENKEMIEEVKTKIKEANKTFNINFEYDTDGKISVIILEEYVEERESD